MSRDRRRLLKWGAGISVCLCLIVYLLTCDCSLRIIEDRHRTSTEITLDHNGLEFATINEMPIVDTGINVSCGGWTYTSYLMGEFPLFARTQKIDVYPFGWSGPPGSFPVVHGWGAQVSWTSIFVCFVVLPLFWLFSQWLPNRDPIHSALPPA